MGSQIVHVELTLGHFGRELIRIFLFHHFGRAFDQADNVTHAKNTASNPAWVESLNRVKLFAHACKFDWLASNSTHRQGSTAACVTVHAGQHDTRQINALAEAFSDINGVLTREGVDHQQNFLRCRNLCHRLHFVHQLLINVQTACGIEDEDVKTLQFCRLHRPLGDIDRHLPLNDWQSRNLCLRTKRGQLLLRSGTIDVKRGHEDFFALLSLQHLGDFSSRRGFTRTLQTNHHDNRRWRNCQIQIALFSAKHLDKRVVDDLHDLLPRRNRFQHLRANG